MQLDGLDLDGVMGETQITAIRANVNDGYP